jgi:4-hydroxybenzoate polyprenyltransferase
LILPFDIRDVQFDVISLQTIPKKIGVEKTKKLGYVLVVAVALVLCITQELDILIDMDFPANSARTVLLAGLAAPVFLVSLVYYRIKRSRMEQSTRSKASHGDSNADH